MKKYVLGIVAVHILFLYPLIRPGIFDTHDGQLHIARIAAYDKAIREGQFPVRWAADLNYTYGSPLFIFYYPLPYFLGTIVHWIGFNYTDSFKILLGMTFLAAPVGFYLWMKSFFPPGIAVVSAFVYGLAPYHFLDLFVRGAIGELFAFVFIPIVLLGIEKIHNKSYSKGLLITSFIYALLILSHNAFALLFSAVFIFYGAIRLKIAKPRIIFSVALLIGLGISAHFWLPSIIEQKYTHVELFNSSKYLDNFPSIRQLIWSPWGPGKEVTQPGGLSPQVGIIQFFIVLLAICFIHSIKKQQWLLFFGLMLLIIGIYFSQRTSMSFWNNITFLKRFEFPWRFTGLISFSAAIISGVFFNNKPIKPLIVLVVAGIILGSISLTMTAGQTYHTDQFFETFNHSTDFGGASTIWTAGDPYEKPKMQVEIASGEATITNYKRIGTLHIFDISASTPATIIDNTHYYPGWHVSVNDATTPIEYQDANHRGLITFTTPKGESHAKVYFEETALRKLTDIISTVSIAVFLILGMGLWLRNR